jgi:hypothetical protein
MRSQISLESKKLADQLVSSTPRHPALQRLSAKLGSEMSTGQLISRYDRMHNRHNRSYG